MTRIELAWLAGWLEGEGTFYFSQASPGSTPRAIIQAFSTDNDVIQKAAKIAVARIYFIKPRKETTWNRLEGWRLSLECKPAIALMRKLLPFMGTRRTAQIQKALSAWDSRANKPKWKLCACGCGRKVFGGPRILYARRPCACAQAAYRNRQKEAATNRRKVR